MTTPTPAERELAFDLERTGDHNSIAYALARAREAAFAAGCAVRVRTLDDLRAVVTPESIGDLHVSAPSEHDRSRAAQMIAYADGELELRDAIARVIADARAEGRVEALRAARERADILRRAATR